jgi:hypothetical protein
VHSTFHTTKENHHSNPKATAANDELNKNDSVKVFYAIVSSQLLKNAKLLVDFQI